MGAPAAPYLSIVITGRNDGYGGDFVERFLATLRFNHFEMVRRGISHEVVLVEWAPPAGAPLLADIVEERCPGTIAASLRTFVVDPRYHEALSLNPRLEYHEFLAKNAGIRRSRGSYVLTTNCDVIFGRKILQKLSARRLEPGIVYRAARYDLTAGADLGRITWNYLEAPANLLRPGKPLEPPYFRGGTGDFIALDRASFDALGGFNEVYRVARVGIDGNFLVQALSCGLRIADINGPVYHISHEGSFIVTRQRYAGAEWTAPYGDERWHSGSVTYRNPSGWGLASAPTTTLGPRRTRLEFSWDAVPPLVDLSRVVLPARRPRRRMVDPDVEAHG
jgi:hypothetical protein